MVSTKQSLSLASPPKQDGSQHSLRNSDDRKRLGHILLLLAQAETDPARQGFGAKLTVEEFSPIAISPSAQLNTPSVKGAATLPSSQKQPSQNRRKT